MTAIVGVQWGDCVVMAADGVVSTGTWVTSRKHRKILTGTWVIGPDEVRHWALGFSGDLTLGRIIFNWVEENDPCLLSPEEDDPEPLFRILRERLMERSPVDPFCAPQERDGRKEWGCGSMWGSVRVKSGAVVEGSAKLYAVQCLESPVLCTAGRPEGIGSGCDLATGGAYAIARRRPLRETAEGARMRMEDACQVGVCAAAEYRLGPSEGTRVTLSESGIDWERFTT